MGIKRLLCAIVVAMVLAACTSAARPPSASRTAPPLSGEILAVASTPAPSSIVEYQLPGAVAAKLPSPIGAEAANRSTFAGAPLVNGSAFVVANGGSARAYRLSAGADRSTAIGPTLRVGANIQPTLWIDTGAALVGTCDGVWLLSLMGGGRWERVAGGCWGAIAPNGRSLAYSADGRHVEVRSLVGRNTPKVLLDLADLGPLLGEEVARPRLMGAPAWAPQGLAFSVRAGDQLGIFVREPSGTVVKVLQEVYANIFREPRLAWQPGGRLLAITDDVGPGEATLRLFDPAGGDVRAVAVDPMGFAGLAWSPDGEAIAVLTGTSALLVVDPVGTWLLRVKTDWRGLLAWTGGSAP